MEVILFETVPNLGLPGAVVDVAPGYFRNFLSPNGLAVEATESNQKKLQDKLKKLEAKAEEERKAARSDAEKIEEMSLTFFLKAGADGKLFGSVTNIMIAEELEKKGIEIDRHLITLPEQIKRTGKYEVDIKLHHDVDAKLTVEVEKEPDDEEEAAKARTAE